jgi:hypothetical protein
MSERCERGLREVKDKIDGRHAEIVPRDGSHYVLVDGQQWSRRDSLAKGEAVRQAIVERWGREYEDNTDYICQWWRTKSEASRFLFGLEPVPESAANFAELRFRTEIGGE